MINHGEVDGLGDHALARHQRAYKDMRTVETQFVHTAGGPSHDSDTFLTFPYLQHAVAKLLLDSGAQINSLVPIDGRDTRTALARAVAGKHVDMVVLLLTYSARILLHDPRSPAWTTEVLAFMQGMTLWSIIRQAKQTEIGRGDYAQQWTALMRSQGEALT